MAVPDFQSFFKPLLDVAEDGKEHSMKRSKFDILSDLEVGDTIRASVVDYGVEHKRYNLNPIPNGN